MVVLAGAPELLLLLPPPPELPLLTPGSWGAADAKRMLTTFFNTVPLGARFTLFTLANRFFTGVAVFFLITPLPDIAALLY
jgi:hypothetical protein